MAGVRRRSVPTFQTSPLFGARRESIDGGKLMEGLYLWIGSLTINNGVRCVQNRSLLLYAGEKGR